jgi:hypothetical protein
MDETMADQDRARTTHGRRNGIRSAAILAVLASASLLLGACASGQAIGPVSASSPTPSAAVEPVPPSASPAGSPPLAGAPCISATDPSLLCGGGSTGPLPSTDVPVDGSGVGSPVPPPVPVGPAPVASTAPAPGKPATSSTSATVTAAENGTTLHLAVGERFTLELGAGVEWAVKVADPAIVAPVSGVTLAPGVQGVYEAIAPGTTVLNAVGSPSCTGGACPQFRIGFTLTIAVS